MVFRSQYITGNDRNQFGAKIGCCFWIKFLRIDSNNHQRGNERLMEQWIAVRSKPRAEKVALKQLEKKGMQAYLPLVTLLFNNLLLSCSRCSISLLSVREVFLSYFRHYLPPLLPGQGLICGFLFAMIPPL